MPSIIRLLSILSLWLTAFPVWAHDPGLSSAEVEITGDQIALTFMMNPRDAQLAGVSNTNAIRQSFEMRLDGVALIPTTATGPTPDTNNNVVSRLVFPRAKGGTQLSIHALFLAQLPFGHRQFLKVQNAAGMVLAEQLLRQQQDTCTLTLAAIPSEPPREAPTFVSFLALGIQHILTGYDHLLFLGGLLLVCVSFRQAAAIITCFTVAHSITLALATFGIVTLSSRIVEPAIAASIAYVGLENFLRHGQVKWRWLLTFGFGLIHGLGFASALQEMGIGTGTGGIVLPLVSFNLGVEIGQLSVAALLLPMIFALRRQPVFLRLGIPAGSLAIAIAGAFWFIQRTLLA